MMMVMVIVVMVKVVIAVRRLIALCRSHDLFQKERSKKMARKKPNKNKKKKILSRVNKELQELNASPPFGICVFPHPDSNLLHLSAQMTGPKDTPFALGLFHLDIQLPEKYPFEPPLVRFVTPVYHPNIDQAGRICLDLLNMPPKGAWKPSLSLSAVLASIRLLLADPNPDDGLVAEIAAEFKTQRSVFDAKARRETEKHATGAGVAGAAPAPAPAPQPAPAPAPAPPPPPLAIERKGVQEAAAKKSYADEDYYTTDDDDDDGDDDDDDEPKTKKQKTKPTPTA
jgi:ubiquitin-conjugating enzyme E2 T